MPEDLIFDVERYVELVDYLPEEEEPEEVIYTFLYRDRIHEALKAGARLPEALARALAAADDRVMAMRTSLVRRFPGVFTERAPREYWWWHLEKGPDVREQVTEVA